MLQKNGYRLFIFTILILTACCFSIKIPKSFAASNVVNPLQTYTYKEMEADIKNLAKKYPDIIHYKSIGKSEYGKNIYAISLGKGDAPVFINGAHHAREWLTTNLNMFMLDQYAQYYNSNKTVSGYNVKKLLDQTTIWFVPMVNPDGVTLQQSGLNAFPEKDHAKLIKMNDGSKNFKRWKANAKGVDLNRQYDADWKNIVGNPGKPFWQNYKGTAPNTASETKAIVNFTYQIDPEIAVAYHTAGKILYWNFHQTGSWYNRDLSYAKKMGSMTGYSLVYPGPNPSGGGMTDWFIIKFKRPGFTPEIGTYPGNTNLSISQFNTAWNENKLVGLYTAEQGYSLYKAKHKETEHKVNLKINGDLVKLDQSSLIIKGRTMVPVRGVFETLGASVDWHAATETITIRKGTKIITLKVGSTTTTVDGVKKSLDSPAQMVKGRTMVPLRFIAEALGASVSWDANTETANITYKDPIQNPVPSENYQEINVIIDEVKKDFETSAILQNNTTFVPLREILQGSGATFENNETKVILRVNGMTITLEDGSSNVLINDQRMDIGSPVMTLNGRMMIPTRLYTQIIHSHLSWDNQTLTITLTTIK